MSKKYKYNTIYVSCKSFKCTKTHTCVKHLYSGEHLQLRLKPSVKTYPYVHFELPTIKGKNKNERLYNFSCMQKQTRKNNHNNNQKTKPHEATH